jgi:DNA repair exonuclease SbcCD ATPase subunit
LIIFKIVRWRNFLSTGNNFIEIQLDRNPTTLIIGENGAGKSTVLDALCFGLFGRPFRNINKPQLLNSINNRNCVVEIEFEIGSKKLKVIRGLKPNIFKIYINGKMYNQDANVRDYQKYLEQQILKLNYRSFSQVVILGSSTFIPFMQLRSKHRREVVEEILDIQIFSLMNMLLKMKLRDIANDIKSVEYQYELTGEKIVLHKKYIEDMKKNKKEFIKEKSSLLASNEEEIFKKKSDSKSYLDNNKKLLLQISDNDKVIKAHIKLKDIRSTLREKKKNNAGMVEFFEGNADCPTCEQHIDENFKEIMIKKYLVEVNKFTDALIELKEMLLKSNKRQEDISEIAKTIRENEVHVAKENSSIVQLEKFNFTLQLEIDQLQLGEVSKIDYDKLKKLKLKMASVGKQRKKLKEDQIYAEAVKNMLQDTGIKTKIIKQYLPIMNKLINTYLTAMEFYVNFTLDENFNETIKSRYRDEFTYDSFSEGEKMRIDLALLFTWRAVAKMKNSTNTNLLMLDEIFDSSLDSTGTDEFLKILNTLGGENVFVISHKQDALSDKFKSTIKFEKTKNFSHVVD